MDYKELICALRNKSTLDAIAYSTDAADAIEALLAERDAAEKNEKICRAALDKWGAQIQTVVAIEELSELQKELCKALRGMQHNNHIAEEIADASIMLEQMTMLFSVQDAVLYWRKSKLDRLERQLKGEDDA